MKSRTFQRKPMLQLPCNRIQFISLTPLQDMMPFSDLLLCSGLPLTLHDMLAEVRAHVHSSARSVPAQDLDDCCIGKDVVPLTDCMTGSRMSLPGRTIYCRHASAFDLPGFLDAAIKTGLWRCPLCLPCSLEVRQHQCPHIFSHAPRLMYIIFAQQVPQRPLLLRELHVDALMLDIVTSCASPLRSSSSLSTELFLTYTLCHLQAKPPAQTIVPSKSLGLRVAAGIYASAVRTTVAERAFVPLLFKLLKSATLIAFFCHCNCRPVFRLRRFIHRCKPSYTACEYANKCGDKISTLPIHTKTMS